MTVLDFTEIRMIFENDGPAIEEFTTALQHDLTVVINDFQAAAQAHDFKCFRDAAHKTKSFVRIFKPKEYVAALQETKAIYEGAEWEKLSAANGCLIEELERIISILRSPSEK